jgi:hypothetical protein
MRNILFCVIFIIPFAVFGQWVDILSNSTNIFVLSPEYFDEIPVKKGSDTVSFDEWMNDLKLNGMPELGYTVDDIAALFSMDQIKLSEAYNVACSGCQLKWPSLPASAIEFPDMQFLYRGYDNVFKVAANWSSGAREYRIEATDATIKTFTRNNQIMHTINPKGKTSEVKVIYKDAEGIEKEYGPWIYAVRTMPKPEIFSTSISKTTGGKINIGMPSDFFIQSSFLITKLEVNGTVTLESNEISPDLLKKIKVGKKIPLIVTATNLSTEEEVVINGLIEVKE